MANDRVHRGIAWLSRFLVGIGFALWGEVGAAQTLSYMQVHHPNARSMGQQLFGEGFDVPEGSIRDTSFDIIVTAEELAVLRSRGIEPELLDVGRPFRDVQAERASRHPHSRLAAPAVYFDLTEILNTLNTVAATYPSLASLVDLTATYGMPTTSQGRHLFALKISDNVTMDEDEPAHLLVAAHHSRELATPMVALELINQLTTGYGVDPAITSYVDDHEIWIAPVWNPDGYEYVFSTDRWWRKNRTVFGGAPSQIGVDLNRNYPFGWGSPCSGSGSVSSVEYRGPSSASEAETQTMVAFAADRRFAKLADIHSFALEVRYGFACLTHPYTSFLQGEAAALAASTTQYVAAPSCCTAGNIGYQNSTNGTHSFLWEMGPINLSGNNNFQPPFATAQVEVNRTMPAIFEHLYRPVPLSGRVTDAETGDPLVATITYVGEPLGDAELNESHFRFGRYHVFLPAQPFMIQFSAPGFISQVFAITITTDTAQVLDVALARNPTPTPSPTDTPVPTASITPSATETPTVTATVTATETPTVTASVTGTATSTVTPTRTPTPISSIVCAQLPRLVCATPGYSRFSYRDGINPPQDQMQFVFRAGSNPITLAEFGDPLNRTSYAVCVYLNGTLAHSHIVAPDVQKWVESPPRTGYRYHDRSGVADGIFRMQLRAGGSGGPRPPDITLRGRGALLPHPVLPILDPNVTVQVTNDDSGICFSQTFAAPFARNDRRRFIAKQ